jgi:hypothetical protein
MTYDTAEFETEVVDKYLTYYRIRRSDSDYITTASPWETFLPHLKALEAEGFKSQGQHVQTAVGKHIIRYRRDRPAPMTVADLIAALQRHTSKWPVMLALGPDAAGQYREIPVEAVFEAKSHTIQLRGRLPDAR